MSMHYFSPVMLSLKTASSLKTVLSSDVNKTTNGKTKTKSHKTKTETIKTKN